MKNLGRQEGFSLIELLIAIVLLMVGFLGALTVIWTSSRAGSFSRQMTTVANLDEDMMEQINTLSYSNSSLDETNGSFVDFTGTNITATGFTRKIKVQDDVPAANTKTVTVKISWKDGAVTKTRTFAMVKRRDF